MEAALDALTSSNYDRVAELAALPDMIRGYEDVKLASVGRYKSEIERLLSALGLELPFGPVLDAVAHSCFAPTDSARAA